MAELIASATRRPIFSSAEGPGLSLLQHTINNNKFPRNLDNNNISVPLEAVDWLTRPRPCRPLVRCCCCCWVPQGRGEPRETVESKQVATHLSSPVSCQQKSPTAHPAHHPAGCLTKSPPDSDLQQQQHWKQQQQQHGRPLFISPLSLSLSVYHEP